LIDKGRNFKMGMTMPAHPRLDLPKITTWKGDIYFSGAIINDNPKEDI
jgi:hypothetical protein